MEHAETKEFFELVGEIWRDVTLIEFLMRCAIAQQEGDANKFPKPPYTKGVVYMDYPRSFSHHSFEDIVKTFNGHFPNIQIPNELVSLRHAMAHGIIAEVDHSGVVELIKFKEQKKDKALIIEFSLPLEPQRVTGIRNSLRALRRHLAKEVGDKK